MRNKTRTKALAAMVMLAIFGCSAKKAEAPAPEVDKNQIKKEIQAKEDEYAASYNAGVIKDIGYYADDAITFYQDRAPLVGKQAIVDFIKSDIISNSNKISFKTNEVFVSSDGTFVTEIGSFKVVDSTNAVINTGNYMSLFEKRNGKYVSLRDMSVSDAMTP